METPICEECDLELHRFGAEIHGKYVEGWCCDGCGWSWDDEDLYDEMSDQGKEIPHKLEILYPEGWTTIPIKPPKTLTDKIDAEYLLNNPDYLFANIIRMWDQEKIVRFAKHLLGEECQKCNRI